MRTIYLKIFNFFYWLPVSVGNHTNYGGGGGHGGGGGGGDTYHSNDYSYSGSSGGHSDNPIGLYVVIGIIVLTIIYVITSKIKDKRVERKRNKEFADEDKKLSDSVIAKIKEHDPDFSKEKFLSWANQVFCQLQEAWTERDWTKARPFESEELFNLHKSQLDEYIRNGTINIMKNVRVNSSRLIEYKQEGNNEYVLVFMETSYNDYIIKEDTKKVVRGKENITYHIDYHLKFMRTLGVKTGELSNKSTHNCPNCGAPVNVNAAGQCAYCGTVITDGHHDWVLCDLNDIKYD